MRVLFTCGGTAGHVNPALAVADLVKSRDRKPEILFVGADGGMERDLVTRAGYAIKTVPVSSLRHSLKPAALLKNAQVLLRMAGSLRAARRILRDFRPDAVLGTGGYASFPVVWAAAGMGIPTAVHESNALPGLTTRLLARRASRVLISFEEARTAYRRPQRLVLTGTPVKSAFWLTGRAEARAALGLRQERPVVVSCFGSLGARDMNRFMVDFIARAAKDGAPFQHIHATGKFGWAWMPDALRDAGVSGENTPGLRLFEYIYNMPTVMAAADLLITRAGASTLAELMAAGRPAILIPSPNVTGDHQAKNARALAAEGGAVMLPESECSGEKLYGLVNELLGQHDRLTAMQTRLHTLAQPDAAEKIYELLRELAHARR